jgi:hypothetical protein
VCDSDLKVECTSADRSLRVGSKSLLYAYSGSVMINSSEQLEKFPTEAAGY